MFNLLALSDIDNFTLICIPLLPLILQVSTHLHTPKLTISSQWLSQDISLFLHEISMSFYVS